MPRVRINSIEARDILGPMEFAAFKARLPHTPSGHQLFLEWGDVEVKLASTVGELRTLCDATTKIILALSPAGSRAETIRATPGLMWKQELAAWQEYHMIRSTYIIADEIGEVCFQPANVQPKPKFKAAWGMP